MNERVTNAAPAPGAENIDKIIRTEKNTLECRSRGDATVDAVDAFVGTVPFVMLKILPFAG